MRIKQSHKLLGSTIATQFNPPGWYEYRRVQLSHQVAKIRYLSLGLAAKLDFLGAELFAVSWLRFFAIKITTRRMMCI
ncbi:hypothetical protein ACSS6W_001855 [Trichoderma asperelloides]